jgi:subtilisin
VTPRTIFNTRSVLRAVPLALVALALLLVAGAGDGAEAQGPPLERFIVQTAPGAAPNAVAEVARQGGRVLQTLEFTPNTIVVAIPAASAAAIAQVVGVTRVEPDAVYSIGHHRPGHGGGPGNDGGEPPPPPPPQETPWGIDKIEAPAAWAVGRGAGAKVCVVDTGADASHPDLGANIVAGRNFTGGGPFANNVDPNKWQDGNGHGTHVAGTVAAIDNSIGVVGVAPEASLVIAKGLSDSGSGYASWLSEAIKWCGAQGAQVVNMSWGSSSASSTIHDALKSIAANTVLVAASGNSGGSQPGYPARFPEVIAVGATDSSDVVASWSNDGEDVLAPGVGVKSTVPGGGYDTYSGTSMASPHAAGVAALIIGSGTTSPGAVRSTLSSTADAVAGGVRINAASAVGASVFRVPGGLLVEAA